MLKNTGLPLSLRHQTHCTRTIFVNNHHLTRIHFTNISCLNQIQCACFGHKHHRPILTFPHDQGSKTMRIAGGHQFVLSQKHQ
eukprot:Gb_09153 [translate_table: standard]